ncbi:hypothetical protein FACS1894158_09160 [Betaproteobacteria bacterium]|nr:hypothetical protein FACS1894158_09160 [Betaproteobacteria bacterium]
MRRSSSWRAQAHGGRVKKLCWHSTFGDISVEEDRRKGKHLRWKEAKITLAHALGSQTLAYGGTLEGDASQAGRILFDTACRAGFGHASRLHAVGDGAPWIVSQVDERFGQNGPYLLDFFHVCE